MARRSAPSRTLALSRAPAAFAGDIDGFIAFLDLERGLSRHTRENYQRDLDQAAVWLTRQGVKDWRQVTAAQAGEWLHALTRGGGRGGELGPEAHGLAGFRAASCAGKDSAG